MDWGLQKGKYVLSLKELKEYIILDSEEENKLQEIVKIHPMEIITRESPICNRKLYIRGESLDFRVKEIKNGDK